MHIQIYVNLANYPAMKQIQNPTEFRQNVTTKLQGILGDSETATNLKRNLQPFYCKSKKQMRCAKMGQSLFCNDIFRPVAHYTYQLKG